MSLVGPSLHTGLHTAAEVACLQAQLKEACLSDGMQQSTRSNPGMLVVTSSPPRVGAQCLWSLSALPTSSFWLSRPAPLHRLHGAQLLPSICITVYWQVVVVQA
jgi:hypothetical protein